MDLQDKKFDFEKLIEHVAQDISSVRTNRATPALIENIQIDVYGSKMAINQLASISSPEPSQLLVEAWDKNVLKDIEKAIQTKSLGLSVLNDGNFIRLSIQPMTEESRNEIIKTLYVKVENGKISLRTLRDKVKEEIILSEKNKEISEDEKFALIEDLNEMVRKYSDEINELGKKKEKEVML